MNASEAPAVRRPIGIGTMIFVALAAFGFSFALVPLYRIACEKVLGIRLERSASNIAETPGSNRVITVVFDANVNVKLPWEFAPSQMRMQVQPGRLYETTYSARNISDHGIVGNAVPSVVPALASKYFSKTECFCFTAQTLAPGESREMPVRFIVDPDLPADVRTLTLSYTFFKNNELTARLAASGTTSSAAGAAP